MKNISDNSIDMILCDLPYGTTRAKWDEIIPFDKLWNCYLRIIKDNGAIVLFGSEPFSSKLRMSNLSIYKYDWTWKKPNGTGFLNAKKQPIRIIENIVYFIRNNLHTILKCEMGNLMFGIAKEDKVNHTTNMMK